MASRDEKKKKGWVGEGWKMQVEWVGMHGRERIDRRKAKGLVWRGRDR